MYVTETEKPHDESSAEKSPKPDQRGKKKKKKTAHKQINNKNGSIQFEHFFSTLHFIIIIGVLNVGFFFGVIVRSLSNNNWKIYKF